MKLSPQQLAAVFEHLQKTGKLRSMGDIQPPAPPKVLNPAAKMMNPLAPSPITLPGNKSATPNSDAVNPNFVGKGRKHQFKKINKMFGI